MGTGASVEADGSAGSSHSASRRVAATAIIPPGDGPHGIKLLEPSTKEDSAVISELKEGQRGAKSFSLLVGDRITNIRSFAGADMLDSSRRIRTHHEIIELLEELPPDK